MPAQSTTLTRILTGELAELDRVTAPYTQPRRTRRAIVAAVLVAIVTAALVVLATAAARQAAISEDSERWDCHTMGNRVCGAAATEDATGTACGDATPGTLTAAAVSDLARYGTAQTRCLVLPAVLTAAGPSALPGLCVSGVGAVDLTTDAPTVTCRTR